MIGNKRQYHIVEARVDSLIEARASIESIRVMLPMFEVFKESVNLVARTFDHLRISAAQIIVVPRTTKLVYINRNHVGSIMLKLAQVQQGRVDLPVERQQHPAWLDCGMNIFYVILSNEVPAAIVE